MRREYDRVEWDDIKSDRNRRLRKFDFAFAARVFLGEYLEEESQGDFAERRFVAIGVVDALILTVVWTPRGAARRIISARRSSRRERQRYCGYRPEETL